MRNIVLVICFALCAIMANAQNQSVEIARIEFKKGNYKDAVGLYNGAIATVTDANLKNSLINEKKKSSKCWQNIELADRYFRESNFSVAQRYYGNILSDNPSDSYAQNQRDKCVRNIENARLLALEKKRIDALWVELMSTNNIEGLKTFAQDYPTYGKIESLKKILDYYNNPSKIDNGGVSIRRTLYVDLGNAYYEYNKVVAAQFYEKAAMCGSLVGFYNLAISLPEKEENRAKRLLVVAAVNGQEDAVKLLESKYPNLKYNNDIPKLLYDHLLKANNGRISSAIIIQKNKLNIGLPTLNTINDQLDYTSGWGVDFLDYGQYEWQYELGMMYLNGNSVSKNPDKALSYLYDAASQGNYTAQYQLAKIMKDKDDYYAFALCAAVNGCVDAQVQLAINNTELEYLKAYVQYIKEEKCNFFDMYKFLSFYAKFYKIEDADAELVSLACYQFLKRKQHRYVTKMLKSRSNWNKQTISKIQSLLANSSNKYHKKLLKQLPKIKVMFTKVEPILFQKFVKEGFCTYPHHAKTIEIVDFISSTSNRSITN